MKKHLSTIILILVFFVGLSVLLYPTVSNYINSFHQSQSVAAYKEQVDHLSKEDYSKYKQAMQTYNQNLQIQKTDFYSGDPITEQYQSLISKTGGGMMGYVSIKKIGIQLPIYYGTSEAVLSAGTGHLEGSSIPIGGVGTHAVITGHRGLPSAKLFTDLDKMEVGDIFTITILNDTLIYKVDKISIIEPDDDKLLAIDLDGNYVTLVTCTPYGINSHRLLVRGVSAEDAETVRVVADAIQLETAAVAPVVAAPILIILLILLLASPKKTRSDRGKDGE